MGMFDTFDATETYECLHCNHTFEIKEGVQSKHFECTLDYYRVGDIPYGVDTVTKVVQEYDWCPKCNESIDLFFGFHKSIYTGCFKTYTEAEASSDNFDLLSMYIKCNKNRVAFTDNFNGMRNDLQTVYDLHTKKPTSNKFSSFLFLKFDNVLDYNPIQTIKNIIDKYKNFK